MHSKQSKTALDRSVITVTKKTNPRTIRELVKLVQQERPLPEQKILKRIMYLQEQGKIVLREHLIPSPPLIKSYIFSTKANWYWTIIVVAAITAALVFIVPEDAYPIVYARYLFGSMFILFFPGYTFTKILFSTKDLDSIARVVLSIGMSLALVFITGLLLNYTSWGIRTAPVTFSLLALTISFATAAIIRERQANENMQ